MLVESEYTSKTLCPPQLWESGSSCMARKPHSAFPVIGSTGILRRNRTLVGVLEVVQDRLDAAQLFVRGLLVPVDGVSHFAQIAPQFSFSLTHYGDSRKRQRGRREHHENSAGDN